MLLLAVFVQVQLCSFFLLEQLPAICFRNVRCCCLCRSASTKNHFNATSQFSNILGIDLGYFLVPLVVEYRAPMINNYEGC